MTFAVLAVLGMVVIMTPLLIYAFDLSAAGWHWSHAALFVCMIASTDAVAVTAVLKKANGPETLGVLMEGESLFNDATSIVLFEVTLQSPAHAVPHARPRYLAARPCMYPCTRTQIRRLLKPPACEPQALEPAPRFRQRSSHEEPGFGRLAAEFWAVQPLRHCMTVLIVNKHCRQQASATQHAVESRDVSHTALRQETCQMSDRMNQQELGYAPGFPRSRLLSLWRRSWPNKRAKAPQPSNPAPYSTTTPATASAPPTNLTL